MSSGKNFLIRVLQSRIFFVVLIMIAVISVVRLGNEVARRTKISNEIQKLEHETEQLRNQQETLSSLITYLNTDGYIEDQARKKLGLGQPGEKVVVVQDTATSTTASLYADQSTVPVRAWWTYFFGNG